MFIPPLASFAHSHKLPCLSRRIVLWGFCNGPDLSRLQRTKAALKAADRLLLAFDEHMEQVQGLTAVTRKARRRYARELLERKSGRRPLQLRALKSSDLFGFVNERALQLKGQPGLWL